MYCFPICGLIMIHTPNQRCYLPEPNIWRGLQPKAALTNADDAVRHPTEEFLHSARKTRELESYRLSLMKE